MLQRLHLPSLHSKYPEMQLPTIQRQNQTATLQQVVTEMNQKTSNLPQQAQNPMMFTRNHPNFAVSSDVQKNPGIHNTKKDGKTGNAFDATLLAESDMGTNHSAHPESQSSESSVILYSPTFQCFATIPFYAALMLELQTVTKVIDVAPESAREIVWQQLFSLIGAPAKRCTNLFGPVLDSWLKAPTVNLLAIELLYLSFTSALLQHPELVSSHGVDQEATAPHEINPKEVPKESKVKSQKPFFTQVDDLLQMTGHSKGVNNLPKLVPPSFSSKVPTTGESVLTSSPHNLNMMQPKDLRYLNPSIFPSSAGANSEKEPNPLFNKRKNVPISTESNSVSKPQPSASESGHAQMFPPKPSSAPLPQNDLSVLQRLTALMHWAPTLDSMPQGSKEALWNISCLLPGFKNYDIKSFTHTCELWSSDVATNMGSITILFSSLMFLLSTGVLNVSLPVISAHNSGQTQARGSDSPPVANQSSEEKPDKKRPRLMDITSLVC